MTGMITGGWNFVIAAYVISALVYGGYVVSVWRRLKDAESMDELLERER